MESAPAADRDPYVIGCDIGGTFTDFVVADTSTGRLAVKKLVTTPSDPSRAVIDGVRALAAENPALLGRTAEFVHATTLVVNAVIEGKGARTALVTTAGFRDLLEVRRHVRVSNFEMMNDPREPLVPRALRIALDERTYGDGRILTPLDETEIDEAIQVLREQGVESVAVSFLHSYANATNEYRLAEAIARACPDLPVSLSSRVLPEKGEYERTVTTVVNAYVKPVASRYLDALRERLAAEGLEARARTVLVPPRAGVMSAVGLLATPPSYDLTRTHDVALAALDPATLAAVFEELEEEVRGQLRRVGSGADVVWPRLVSIADEMATTLVRTAHSHDVVEVHDMSTAIYDAAGTFLAMSAVGAHSHVYSMAQFISALLEEIPPERMREGDAFVTNDPWLNPGHTADVLVGTPVFVHGRLVGFTVTSAHQVDMTYRKYNRPIRVSERACRASRSMNEQGSVVPRAVSCGHFLNVHRAVADRNSKGPYRRRCAVSRTSVCEW